MNTIMPRPGTSPAPTVLLVAIGILAIPQVAMAQRGPGVDGPRAGLMRGAVDPLALVLENAEELELTEEQRTSIEAIQSEYLEATAAARAAVEARRTELEEEREDRTAPERMRRGERERPEPTPEMREAMETLRAESRTAMEGVDAALDEGQVDSFRDLIRDDRRRNMGADRADGPRRRGPAGRLRGGPRGPPPGGAGGV